VTLESLARQALLDNPGNKIGAIKALRNASQEYPDLLPDNAYGSLGLAEAKTLIEKVMGY
jgi:ribosomal protein L7/L12